MLEDGFYNYTSLMHCGVYALLRRGVVVYVGQSKALCERLRTHIRTRHKTPKRVGFTQKMATGISFDQLWVRPCMMAELDVLEMQMIKKYQPKYNVIGTNREKEKSQEKDVIPEEIKELIQALAPQVPQQVEMAPRGPYIVRRL